MSFSNWMNELRTQQYRPTKMSTSSASVVSSYADTDSELDSDCDSENECVRNTHARARKTHKSAFSKRVAIQRTAPITIPQPSSVLKSSFYFDEEASYENSNRVNYDHSHDSMTTSINADDEDLMLFGNLAYFQTQHGHKSGLGFRQRSSSLCSSNASSDEDEEIFDMEL